MQILSLHGDLPNDHEDQCVLVGRFWNFSCLAFRQDGVHKLSRMVHKKRKKLDDKVGSVANGLIWPDCYLNKEG